MSHSVGMSQLSDGVFREDGNDSPRGFLHLFFIGLLLFRVVRFSSLLLGWGKRR